MANPFVKGWRYLMALFGAKIDEYADPKVQIQQAIEDAQRQHQALVQQAAAVIGNQRQLELKLTRTMDEVQKYQASAKQAPGEGSRRRDATAREPRRRNHAVSQSVQHFADFDCLSGKGVEVVAPDQPKVVGYHQVVLKLSCRVKSN